MDPPQPTNPFLMSSPHRFGTSAHAFAGKFKGLKNTDVAPLIARDLVHAELVDDPDMMLKTFLRLAHGEDIKVKPAPIHVTGLLEQAMKYVCENVCTSQSIRSHLNDYVNATKEEQIYTPFIRLCNEALRLMKTAIVDENLRPVSKLDILFTRNDPQLLRETYQLVDSSDAVWETKLKPDVFTTSLLAAQTRYSQKNKPWDELIDLVSKPPPKYDKAKPMESADRLESFKSREVSDALNPPSASPSHPADCSKPHQSPDSQSPGAVQLPDVAQLPDGSHFHTSTPNELEATDGWEATLGVWEHKTSGHTVWKKVQECYVYTDKIKGDSNFDTKFGLNFQATCEPVTPTTSLRKRAIAATVKGDSPEKKRKGDTGAALPQSHDIQVGHMDIQYQPATKLPAAIQAGIYGANMLNRPGVAAHAIGFVVHDEWVRMWWYDRQGTIQVAAIDFITELPRFLVLLLCLQRFTLEDWGFVPELDSLAVSTHEDPNHAPSHTIKYSSCDVSLKHNPEVLRFSMTGRGTSTVIVDQLREREGGSSLNLPPWPCNDGYHLKVAWIDESHDSEPEILRTARERLSKDDKHDFSRHLPWIVDWKDHGFSTGTIRKKHNFNPKSRANSHITEEMEDARASCVLRTIISERLHPIITLPALEYFKLHLDIAGCLFGCWSVGVGHRDPSLSNFIRQKTSTLDRTGTIPYLSLELLMYPSGNITHELYHDLEATYWVMCWQAHVTPGKVIPKTFADWRQGTYYDCSMAKSAWQNTHFAFEKARPGWEAVGHVAQSLRRAYIELTAARLTKVRRPGKSGGAAPSTTVCEDVPGAVKQSRLSEVWLRYANTVVVACKDWSTLEWGNDTLLKPATQFAQEWKHLGVVQL